MLHLSPTQITNKSIQTFVAVSESPFLARLDVGYPQVVIVDEGYEVRISRADLGVHACPWALSLDLHWLYRSSLLKPIYTNLVKGKLQSDLRNAKTQKTCLMQVLSWMTVTVSQTWKALMSKVRWHLVVPTYSSVTLPPNVYNKNNKNDSRTDIWLTLFKEKVGLTMLLIKFNSNLFSPA